MLNTESRRSLRGALFGAVAAAALVLGMVTIPATSAQAAPASATIDGLVFEADSSTPEAGATITGFTGDLGENVTIPERVAIDGIDYVVTTIGENALKESPLSSVVIPDTVTMIGSFAFHKAKLTSLVIPNSVTTLGDFAFGENPIASLTLPDNGLDIPMYAFFASQLTEVVIPPSIRSIGASAFLNGQIERVDLGNVGVIHQSAFLGNRITDLTIPESTSYIYGSAFQSNQIENLEFLTTGPLRIRGHVFAFNKITKLVLPGTLVLERYSAFEGNRISDLTISEGMTSLNLTTFKNNRLTSVTIPASISKLEAHVFVDNPSLTEIYFDGDAPAEVFPANVSGGGDNESLPSSTATLFFHCAAQGFTTPLWQGYTTLRNPDTACSVNFDTLGGEPVPPTQELEYGGFATPPAETPVRAGSVFTGWFTSPEATELFDFAGTEVTAPVTLYAGWRDSVPRTVSFDTGDGSAVADVVVEHGDVLVKPSPDPVRDGYKFAGWFADAELSEAYDFAAPVMGDLTLYAKWVLNEYAVSFDTGDGSAVADAVVEHGEVLTKPSPDPVRDGYKFAGWFADVELSEPYDFAAPVMGDLTLYAKWVLNEYAVSFDTGDGSAVADVVVEHGEALVRPSPDPVRDGYKFAGWFADVELSEPYDFAAPVMGDLTLYAKWVLNEYTVSFDSRGGSPVADAVVEHGDVLVKPSPDPTRAGYKFAGWFINTELTEPYLFGSKVTADFTLHAKWTAKTPPVDPIQPEPPTQPGDEGETPGGGCPPGGDDKPGGGTPPSSGTTPGKPGAPSGGCTGGIADSGAVSPLAAVAGGLVALFAGAVIVLTRRRATTA